jgi:hypothetical protein
MIVYRGMTFCSDQDCGTKSCPRHRRHVPEEPPQPVAWADFNQGNFCPAFTNEHADKRKTKA